MQSEQSYREALRSREISEGRAVRHDQPERFLMSIHCGLDNRLALPPFMPVLRNGDGVFAQVLKACQPRHLIAHLPVAALHLPGEQRASVESPACCRGCRTC